MGLKRPYGSSPVLLKAVLPISRVSRPFEWRESIFGDAAPDAVLLTGRQGETEALRRTWQRAQMSLASAM